MQKIRLSVLISLILYLTIFVSLSFSQITEQTPVKTISYAQFIQDFCVSPDSRYLYISGRTNDGDKYVKIVNIPLNLLEVTFKTIAEKLCLSPDGQWLAVYYDTYSNTGPLSIYDINKKEILHSSDYYLITSAKFSHDGKLLYIGRGGRKNASGIDKHGYIDILDTGSWKTIQTIDLELGCLEIDISPDGTLVAADLDEPEEENPTMDFFDPIYIYDTAKWECKTKIQGHTIDTAAFCFSPDGKEIVTSGGINTLVWNVTDGTLLRKTALDSQETGTVADLKFSPEGRFLATATSSNYLCLLDYATNTLVRRFNNNTQNAIVGFSPDKKYFFSRSINPGDESFWLNRVNVWDMQDVYNNLNHGEETPVDVPTPEPQTPLTESKHLFIIPNGTHTGKFSQDGKNLYFAGFTGFLICSTTDYHTVKNMPICSAYMAVSPNDQKTIMGIYSDEWPSSRFINVGLVDLTTGNEIYKFPTGNLSMLLNFICNGNYVYTCEPIDVPSDPEISRFSVWDIYSQKEPYPVSQFDILNDMGTNQSMYWYTVSPDGKSLTLSASRVQEGVSKYVLQTYDLFTGKLIWEQPCPNNQMDVIEYTPDGKWIAGGNENDKNLYVFDSQAGNLNRMIPMPEGVSVIRFSPGGKYVLCGNWRKYNRLYNFSSGDLISTYQRFGVNDGDRVTNCFLEFSPDAKSILTYGTTHYSIAYAQLWDTSNLEDNPMPTPTPVPVKPTYIVTLPTSIPNLTPGPSITPVIYWPSPTYTPTPTIQPVHGDINGDGVLTTDDVTFLIEIYMSNPLLTQDEILRLDINGDGRITPQDAQDLWLLIKKKNQ